LDSQNHDPLCSDIGQHEVNGRVILEMSEQTIGVAATPEALENSQKRG
jgi:hypothetical protein